MNLLPKPLRAEVLYYTSDKSIEELKQITQKLIVESRTLVGKFSSENEFYLYPSIQIGVYSTGGFSRNVSNAFLYGKIYEEGIPVNRNCLLSEDLTLIGGNKKPQN